MGSFNFLFIFEKRRESASGGGAERKGDTESEAGSRLRAVSTKSDAQLKLTNQETMIRAKVGGTQVPLKWDYLNECFLLKKRKCTLGVCFGSAYVKTRTIQRRSAWSLLKDDTQIHEVFCISRYWSKGTNSQL